MNLRSNPRSSESHTSEGPSELLRGGLTWHHTYKLKVPRLAIKMQSRALAALEARDEAFHRGLSRTLDLFDHLSKDAKVQS